MFEGPLLAMVPGDATCTVLQEDTVHYCQYPSLIMFDSSTVNKLGLPDEKHGGMRAWIDAATKLSMVYVGSAVYPGRAINSIPARASAVTPLSGPVLSLSLSVRMNVLVVLEGQDDKVTGPIFRDIADIVRDGLRNLGHPTRVVYCANLVTDACFVSGERLIVLAAHNLANYVTLEGVLAVLERSLIPSDSSESPTNCSCRSPVRFSSQSSLYRGGRFSCVLPTIECRVNPLANAPLPNPLVFLAFSAPNDQFCTISST